MVPETRVAIGIHPGMAVPGTVGTPMRKEYTIIDVASGEQTNSYIQASLNGLQYE